MPNNRKIKKDRGGRLSRFVRWGRGLNRSLPFYELKLAEDSDITICFNEFPILIHRGNVEPEIKSSSIKLGVYPVILPDRAHT
jgi:hypothetical protein